MFLITILTINIFLNEKKNSMQTKKAPALAGAVKEISGLI